EFTLEPQEVDGLLALAARVARERSAGQSGSAETPTLQSDAFDFLRDLSKDNNIGWMQAHVERYKASLDKPFRALLEAVADRYMTGTDPELDTEVKTGHVLASIKKRFPDQNGDYHTYLWGAFSRHRKQEDVQLFVVVDSNELRFG